MNTMSIDFDESELSKGESSNTADPVEKTPARLSIESEDVEQINAIEALLESFEKLTESQRAELIEHARTMVSRNETLGAPSSRQTFNILKAIEQSRTVPGHENLRDLVAAVVKR